MDLRDLDRRALASTANFLAAVRPDQLGLPTPCTDWDLRALLNHVIGGNHLFAAAAARTPGDWSARDHDRVGDDPGAAYARSSAAVTDSFAGLDLGADRMELPFGTLPAGRAVAVHFVDVLTHGWDLAVATGQDPTLDPTLADAAIEIVAGYPPELWGNPRFFTEKLPVDATAAAHERLVALLGRR